MAENSGQDEEKKSGKGRLILFLGVVVLAIGASIGGTLYFVDDGEEEGNAAVAAAAATQQAIYHEMRPSFIVNYVTATKPRYLQAELSVMARDPALIEALIDHTPLVRSQILTVLSNAAFEDIRTHDGKEALREELRSTLDALLLAETARSGLESVLFTNFVLQ